MAYEVLDFLLEGLVLFVELRSAKLDATLLALEEPLVACQLVHVGQVKLPAVGARRRAELDRQVVLLEKVLQAVKARLGLVVHDRLVRSLAGGSFVRELILAFHLFTVFHSNIF